MTKQITFKGSPLTLIGKRLKVGKRVRDFKVVDQGLKDVTLKNFEGKIKILTSFPSLDTPVCDLQVKEFNKKAAAFGGDVVIVGISKDLPFAQKRFCEDNDIKSIAVLSDYKYSLFGKNYGLLIKELNLLARSVMIVDKNNILRYLQIVPELTNSPNYNEVLDSLEKILKNTT